MHANHEMRGETGEKGRLALDWRFYIGGADLICMAGRIRLKCDYHFDVFSTSLLHYLLDFHLLLVHQV